MSLAWHCIPLQEGYLCADVLGLQLVSCARVKKMPTMQETRHRACLTLTWKLVSESRPFAKVFAMQAHPHVLTHACCCCCPEPVIKAAPGGPYVRAYQLLRQATTQDLMTRCKGAYPASAGYQPVPGGQVQGQGAGPAAGRARACCESVVDRAHPRHVYYPSPGAPAPPLVRQLPSTAAIPYGACCFYETMWARAVCS